MADEGTGGMNVGGVEFYVKGVLDADGTLKKTKEGLDAVDKTVDKLKSNIGDMSRVWKALHEAEVRDSNDANARVRQSIEDTLSARIRAANAANDAELSRVRLTAQSIQTESSQATAAANAVVDARIAAANRSNQVQLERIQKVQAVGRLEVENVKRTEQEIVDARIRAANRSNDAELERLAKLKTAQQNAAIPSQFPSGPRDHKAEYYSYIDANGMAMARGAAQAKDYSYRLFQVAYAVDDIQYGIPALTNNIVGLTTGFMGTSGAVMGVAIGLTSAMAVYRNWNTIVSMGNNLLMAGIPLTRSSADEMKDLEKNLSRTADQQSRLNELKQDEARIDAIKKIKSAPEKAQQAAFDEAIADSGGPEEVLGKLAEVFMASPLTQDPKEESLIEDNKGSIERLQAKIDEYKRAGASDAEVSDLVSRRDARQAETKGAIDARRGRASRMADNLAMEASTDPKKLELLAKTVDANKGSFDAGLSNRLRQADPKQLLETEAGGAKTEELTDEHEKSTKKYIDAYTKKFQKIGDRLSQAFIDIALDGGDTSSAAIAAAVKNHTGKDAKPHELKIVKDKINEAVGEAVGSKQGAGSREEGFAKLKEEKAARDFKAEAKVSPEEKEAADDLKKKMALEQSQVRDAMKVARKPTSSKIMAAYHKAKIAGLSPEEAAGAAMDAVAPGMQKQFGGNLGGQAAYGLAQEAMEKDKGKDAANFKPKPAAWNPKVATPEETAADMAARRPNPFLDPKLRAKGPERTKAELAKAELAKAGLHEGVSKDKEAGTARQEAAMAKVREREEQDAKRQEAAKAMIKRQRDIDDARTKAAVSARDKLMTSSKATSGSPEFKEQLALTKEMLAAVKGTQANTGTMARDGVAGRHQ